MKNRLLLTGATGLIGQYLLRDLLLLEQPLAVIVRPSAGHSGEQRLEKLLKFWEMELGHTLIRPVCIEGDLTASNMAITTEDRNWIRRHCRSVLHNAASVSFFGNDRAADPWLSNLEGTRNVLKLCHFSEIHALHYVSTAYVSGRKLGVVDESMLSSESGFANDYEQSKFAAESLVRDHRELESTIYRPSIVVGDSRNGYTPSYHGPYLYWRFTWVLSQHAVRDAGGHWHLPLRVAGDPDGLHNFVPVDWVAAVMTQIVHDPRLHGRTYHLTPDHPTIASEFKNAIADALSKSSPRLRIRTLSVSARRRSSRHWE